MVHFHYGLPVHPWHAYTPASRPAVLPQVALVNSLIRAAGLAPAWRQLHWRTRPQAQRQRRAGAMPAWRALRGAGSVTDRSCSLQRLVELSRWRGGGATPWRKASCVEGRESWRIESREYRRGVFLSSRPAVAAPRACGMEAPEFDKSVPRRHPGDREAARRPRENHRWICGAKWCKLFPVL